MRMLLKKSTAVILCFIANIYCDAYATITQSKYLPTWESLDSRPLPEWYDEAKFGIFIHWGVYSVPSFGTEWFWVNWKNKNQNYVDYMTKNYKPGFTYQDFAKDFTGELFDPEYWAEVFQKAGAKYVVLTSKHHEGYTMYPSSYSFSWNSVDVGMHRDVIGDLSTAIRAKTDIKFGIYYSLFEWFNRLYNEDTKNGFLTSEYVDNKAMPELKEIIRKYKPEVIWSDGDWEAPDGYWKSKEFLAWLYNESGVKETVVTNDRWGKGITCKHGDFYTCSDRYNPGVLQPHKWENAMTIDAESWGHRNNARLEDYLTSASLIKELVSTVSCGGNLLLNVGPTKYGTLETIFVERLLDIGRWLKVNGEAIYKSKPWIYQNDTKTSDVWYTSSVTEKGEKNLNAIILDYPYTNNTIRLYAPVKANVVTNSTKVSVKVLGYSASAIKWSVAEDYMEVQFPPKRLLDYFNLYLAWTVQIRIA